MVPKAGLQAEGRHDQKVHREGGAKREWATTAHGMPVAVPSLLSHLTGAGTRRFPPVSEGTVSQCRVLATKSLRRE
eukprot:scaffold657_cov561-Prasinococcus_capsulatus_cf.AAC.4